MKEGATKRGRRFAPLALAITLGVVAAIVGGIALLESGPVASPSTTADDSAKTRAPAGATVATESAPADAAAAAKPDDSPAAAAPARIADALPAAPREASALAPMVDPREGTIVVMDRDGVEHAEESGSFQFELIFPRVEQALPSPEAESGDDSKAAPTRELSTVEVVRGRFRLDVAGFRAIRLESIELGGQLAVDGDVIPVSKPGPISALALWVEPVLLHVIDAATKAELDDVSVVVESEWKLDHLHHPGVVRSEDVIGRGLRSPFSLPPPLVRGRHRARSHYWVGAPGRAWNDVGLAFDEGGAETVELAAAAALTVVVRADLLTREREDRDGDPASTPGRPARPEPPLLVRLRRHATDPVEAAKAAEAIARLDAGALGRVVTEVEARASEYRFDALEPGELFATLEMSGRGGPLLLAVAEVALRAGDTPTITPAPTVPAMVAVAGTLTVPESWNAKEVELTLAAREPASRIWFGPERALPLAAMAPVAARPGTWRWRFDGVSPGGYELVIDRSLGTRWIEVGPKGIERLELQLPDLARVTAHVVDAESGAPVEVLGLSWDSFRQDDWSIGGRFHPEGSRGATDRTIRPASTFFGTFPIGAGQIEVVSAEWRVDDATRTRELATGEQQIEVRVRRGCGVDVTCRVDGKPVQWPRMPPGAGLSIQAIGQEYTWSNQYLTALIGSHRFLVLESGWYRITVPKLDGFTAVAPIEVFVEPERFAKCDVELRRE